MQKIQIRGAKTHNLKNVDLDLPRDKMTVITGLSGSGKSSLAFDTVYAEGQRRYVESLSAYARQFLSMMEKPDVDHIEGLSPAISIEQKSTSHNPRSTVGTVTEIYDYLRLLFARVGDAAVPGPWGRVWTAHAPSARWWTTVLSNWAEGSRLMLLAPVVRDPQGPNTCSVFEPSCGRQGFVRARVDGEIVTDLDDRAEAEPATRSASTASRWWWTDSRCATTSQLRLAESFETALRPHRRPRQVSADMDGDNASRASCSLPVSPATSMRPCSIDRTGAAAVLLQ